MSDQQSKLMWWGYLHQNGQVQLKRWFGDHKDYTDDCEGNDFVQEVVRPFEADSHKQAFEIILSRLGLQAPTVSDENGNRL